MARKPKAKARRDRAGKFSSTKAPPIVRELKKEPVGRSRTAAPREPSARTPGAGEGATARISMGSASSAADRPQLEEPAGVGPASPAAAAELPLEQRAQDQLEQVFTPEISTMIAEVAFGVAAVITGEPEIWQISDDEIRPLAPGIGRQLARIPVVRTVGPDNTELGIVVLGLGVMVTRRLNETAAKKQAERRPRPRAVAREERDASTDVDVPSRTAPAAPTSTEREDGSREPHFGMRAI